MTANKTTENGVGKIPEVLDPVTQDEHVKKLIQGELEPPNDYAKYIIDRIRISLQKGQMISQQLRRNNAERVQLEEDALRLAGTVQSYFADLQQWGKEEKEEPQSERTS